MQCDARKLRASLKPIFAIGKRHKHMTVCKVALVRLWPDATEIEIRGCGESAIVAIGEPARGGPNPVCVLVDAHGLDTALGAVSGKVEVRTDGAAIIIGAIRVQCEGSIAMDDLPTQPIRPLTTKIDDRTIDRFDVVWPMVAPSISGDETRPHLSGVLVSNRAIAATDGHRLHVVVHSPEVKTEDEDRSIVLPGWIGALAAAGGAESLDMTTMREPNDKGEETGDVWQHVSWTDKNGVRASIIAVRHYVDFPPYDQVIPSRQDPDKTLTVKASDLRAMAKQVSGLAKRERTAGVKIEQNSAGLLVTFDHPDIAKAEFHVPVVSGSLPEGFKIGFNARYLSDAMDCCAPGKNDVAELSMDGELDPMLVKGTVLGAPCIAVVMPYRI